MVSCSSPTMAKRAGVPRGEGPRCCSKHGGRRKTSLALMAGFLSFTMTWFCLPLKGAVRCHGRGGGWPLCGSPHYSLPQKVHLPSVTASGITEVFVSYFLSGGLTSLRPEVTGRVLSLISAQHPLIESTVARLEHGPRNVGVANGLWLKIIFF